MFRLQKVKGRFSSFKLSHFFDHNFEMFDFCGFLIELLDLNGSICSQVDEVEMLQKFDKFSKPVITIPSWWRMKYWYTLNTMVMSRVYTPPVYRLVVPKFGQTSCFRMYIFMDSIPGLLSVIGFVLPTS